MKFCYLNIGKHKILLEPGKLLYEFHVDKYSSNYNTPIGEVVINKNNPNLWGILMKIPCDVLLKDKTGKEKSISNGGVIPIVDGLKIKFNPNTVGEILTN